MAGPPGVVGTLGGVGETTETAELANSAEAVAAAGEKLVDVGLMAYVPDDLVLRAVKHRMQSDGELHHSQIGGEMAPRLKDCGHQLLSDLTSQLVELAQPQRLEVGRVVDLVQNAWH
jgi:hypothetical protein